MKWTTLLLLILGLAGTEIHAHSPSPRLIDGFDCDVPVDPLKEIVITNSAALDNVRADAGGPWHIATLLREMMPADVTAAEQARFVNDFIQKSKDVKQVNNFTLQFPGLALGERTVCRWITELGGAGCNADSVDLNRMPYKLIAIVNRLDLHGHGADSAEGRFVFGAVSAPTNHPGTDTTVFGLPETVIFEYALPLRTKTELKTWAERWHALGNLACNTAQDCEPYRVALEKITHDFSVRGLVAGKPNGNSIGQIRTSHLAQGSGEIWSFRQFELKGEGKSAALVMTPTTNAPNAIFNESEELAELLNNNRQEVLRESFVLPQAFLGGESLVDDQKTQQWEFPEMMDETLRASFSGQTCNGCHGETQVTDGFFHISPVSNGNQGKDRISTFLMENHIPKRTQFLKQLLCGEG